MGLSCQVSRDKSGKIERVNAWSGATSKLFQAIQTEHPELTQEEALKHYAKFYTPSFRKHFGDFTQGASKLDLDNNGEPIYNQKALSQFRLSNKLESGFLKDFNITVDEFNALTNHIRKNSNTADFIGKVVSVSDYTDLTKEAVFFAYMMLGKENGKLKSELKYIIPAWNKYDEKFEFYKKQITDAYGFSLSENVWFNKVRDQIIIDFLAEELVEYYNNPREFEKTGKEAWTQKDFLKLNPTTVIGKLIKWIKDYFKKLLTAQTPLQKNIRLSNIAANIAHEMINQEYRMFDYNLKPDQIKRYYKNTLAKDEVADNIVRVGQQLGLWLTGSLALRAQGDVYRSEKEQLHDLDFVVPYDMMLSQPELFDEILVGKEGDMFQNFLPFVEKVALTLPKYKWFKTFKKSFPDFTFLNAFQDRKTLDSVTVQGVINGEFYPSKGYHIENGERVKHQKDEYIKGTGYFIDFFVNVKPTELRKHNKFLHWRNIMIAKMLFGRSKDISDWKSFNSFIQDPYTLDVSSPTFSYTRDVSIVDTPYAAQTERANNYEEHSDINRYDYEDLKDKAGLIATKYNNKISTKALMKLANSVGVVYEVISQIEAKHITEGSENPWNGESAFFYNDKVYFVGGSITPEMAFHEFSHPLVRYIKTVNKPLFDKLFEDIIKTDEGIKLLDEALGEYFEIQKEGVEDAVKEETIVKALTVAALAESNKGIPSKQFNNVIEKIMYHIKQFLRKLFGSKTKVEKLGVNTSINDLAKMLIKGDKFNVDIELIEEADIVSYLSDRKRFQDDMKKLMNNDKKELLGTITDDMSDAINVMYNIVKKEKGFDSLRDVLINQGRNGYLAEMLDINKYISKEEIKLTNQQLIEKMGEAEYNIKKANTVIDNIIGLDRMMDAIIKHMREIYDSANEQDTIKQMYHYGNLLESLKKYIEVSHNQLKKFGFQIGTNSLFDKITSIEKKIESVDKIILDKYADSISEIIHEVNPMNTILERNHKREVERLEERIANTTGSKQESYRNRLKEEKARFEKNYLTEDKIKLLFAGATKTDNNILNAWLVNYIGNPDPIVGSFGKFLKDTYTKTETATLAKYNDFANTMDKIFKEAGYNYNATQLKKLANDVLFLDESGFIDPETGEFEVYKVKTFLNRFKHYKRDLTALRHEVDVARRNYRNKGTDATKEAFEKAHAKEEKIRTLFFNRKYTDSFYEIDGRLLARTAEIDGKTVNVGEIAKARIDEILDKIQDKENEHRLGDNALTYEHAEIVKAYWTEYRRLFSTRDEYGKPKEGLELEISKALRDYRADKNDHYEWVPLEGKFDRSLQHAEELIKVELENENIPEEEFDQEFEKRLQEWIDNNTRVKIKDSFYEERSRILNIIKTVYDILEKKRKSADSKYGYQEEIEEDEDFLRFDDVWLNINETIGGRRDDDGQPVGTDMTKEGIAYIKDQQELMEEAKSQIIKLSGLTEQEANDLEFYFEVMKNGSKEEKKKYREDFNFLLSKKEALGIDPILRNKLIQAWQDLDGLQQKVPTQYYLDIMNTWYQEYIRPELNDDSLPKELTYEIAEDILLPSNINEFLEKNSEFKEWFEANHYKSEVWDPKLKSKVLKYKRVHVWNVVRPVDNKYYETTTSILQDGTERKIDGVPNLQYWYRKVRDEKMTGYNPVTEKVEIEIGKHQDSQGYWLPKTYEEMKKKYDTNPELFLDDDGSSIPFDKYINHKYRELETDPNNPIFKVLEKLKEFHLKYQDEGLESNHLKLGYELPRYRKDGYQYMGAGELGPGNPVNKIKEIARAIKEDWAASKDNYEEGLNYEDEWKYTKGISAFAPSKSKVPLTGRYKLNEDQVSDDIMGSMMMHMYAIEEHKNLTESQPTAHAFKKLINELNPTDVIDIQNNLRPGPVEIKANKKWRQKAVNALYETWWEGKTLNIDTNKEGWASTSKVMSNILGMASHSFFAFDVPSALKNYFGAKFQINNEALLGQTFVDNDGVRRGMLNYKDYYRGRFYSANLNKDLARYAYHKTSKPLNIQLLEIMDPVAGRTKERFGTSLGRSAVRDLFGFKFPTAHRKYLEMQATLDMYSGMMHSVKVKTKDGNKIDYIDAWELDENGTIKLKDNIADKSWDIGGKNFMIWRNRMHELSGFNQGLYDKMNSSMADRYLLYKAVITMRKFFGKMFLNRFSVKAANDKTFAVFNPFKWHTLEEKWNSALQEFHMGYYARTAKFIALSARTGGDHIFNASKEEYRAFGRTMLEPVRAYLIVMLFSALLGWDPEDDDKWKKMKKRSGVLPMGALTDDEWEKNFNTWGWIQNHAVLTMLQTNQENTFFFSPKQYMDLVGDVTLVSGGSYESWWQIIDDFKEGDRYKKDVGGMFYQQADMNKGWKYLMKSFGLKGKLADPTTTLKNNYKYLK